MKQFYLKGLMTLACSVFFGVSAMAQAPYCASAYGSGCSWGDQIENFSTTGGATNITNNSSGCSGGYYANNTAMVVTIPFSGSFNFSVQAGSAYSQGHRIWIDWNQDNDFNDPGEDVWNSGGYSTAAYTGTITAPATATPGTTRMRVRCSFVAVPSDPCAYQSYGETEDYSITVLAPAANDAGIAEITNPSFPACDLDTNIGVLLSNAGTDTLTSANIHYTINGGTATTIAWTGTVAPFSTMTSAFMLGTTTFSNGDDLKVWCSMPNGVQDSLPQNDTMEIVNMQEALSGTYSIPGDFTSVQESADAMANFGVCDDVVFEIATGTYTVNTTFELYDGVDSSATVTYTSATGNAADVILEYAPTGSADNFVIMLDGADWFTFTDLTLKNNVTSPYGYGRTVTIENGSDHNMFESCRMITGTSLTTSFNMANIYVNGTNHYNSFVDNWVENGAYGVYNRGDFTNRATNFTFSNNTIKRFYYMGAYNYYADTVMYENNTIYNDTTGIGFAYGMYFVECDKNLSIKKNKVYADNQYGIGYGIYMSGCDGSINWRSEVSNNCITVGAPGATSYGYYGFYSYNSGLMNIHNNTFNKVGGSSTNYGMYLSQGGLVSLKNNSVSCMAGGYALYTNSAYAITESDYNNWYTTSSSLIYFNNVYNSLEDYQNGVGYDMHSVNTDPAFNDTLNCYTCNDTLDGGGTSIMGMVDDREGNVRSESIPDIGCSEFIAAGSFTLGADTTLCGNEYTMEAGPAQSVLWTVTSSGGTNTSTDPSFTLSASGEPTQFTVGVNIVTANCGPASDNVLITLVPNAMLDSTTHICADETVTLDAGGGASANYMWSNSEMTQTIEVGMAGTYTVTKDELGCQSTATIDVTQSEGVDILNVEPCDTDLPITLDATISNGVSYAWSGGSSVNTASNTFNAGGTFTVTATDAFSCSSTDTFTIIVLQDPVPVIDETHSGTLYMFTSNNSQFLSANSTFFWSFGDGDTSTLANPQHTYAWSNPSAPSSYQVSLTIDNGCGEETTTTEIVVDPTAIGELSDNSSIHVFPNPANEFVTIQFENVRTEMQIDVVDMSGRTVITDLASSTNIVQLNVSELATGFYTIKVMVDGEFFTTPLMVK